MQQSLSHTKGLYQGEENIYRKGVLRGCAGLPDKGVLGRIPCVLVHHAGILIYVNITGLISALKLSATVARVHLLAHYLSCWVNHRIIE